VTLNEVLSLAPTLTYLPFFLGYEVKGDPNLGNLRRFLFTKVLVRVLGMVVASASVFWVVVVIGAGDTGGFPAGVVVPGLLLLGLLLEEWPCHLRFQIFVYPPPIS